MKIRTFIKFSLLVACLYVLLIIVGFIFNANYLLLTSINTLTPIKISNASDFRVSYTPFAIEFEQLDLTYQQRSFEIKEGKILLENHYLLPSITSIHFDELKVQELKESSALQLENKSSFNLKEYSPSVLFDSYQGMNISIGKLSYQKADTKNININSLVFETGDEGEIPYLYLSLSLPEFFKQTLEINSRIQSNNQAEFHFRNNEGSDIKAKIDFDFDTDNRTKIHGDIQASYGPKLAKPVNEYMLGKDLLQSMQGSLSMTFSGVTTNELDFSEALATQIHKFEITVSSKQDFSFNQIAQLPFSRLQSKTDFSAILKSNGENFNASITIPEKITIDIKANEQHAYFKEYKTLAYLARQNLKLVFPAGETRLLNNNEFNLPNNISLTWSQKGNPAYLDMKLKKIQGKMKRGQLKQGKLEQVNLDYTLSGRWSRFFSTEHTNTVQLTELTAENDFKLSMKVYEKRLHTELTVNARRKSDALDGNILLSSSNWQQDVKYLNEMIAFWNPDIKFIDGELELQSDFSASEISDSEKPSITYLGKLKIKQLDVDNDGFIFNDISFNTSFKGKNQQIDCPDPFPIQVPSIDAGFIISSLSVNASCHFDLHGDSYMDFSQLSANLFGGKLVGDAFRLSIPYNNIPETTQPYHANMIAHVTDIQLKEVLAVMDNPEIQGDGPLYGELPIRFDEKVTLIENGWIKNTTAGVLSYNPDNQTKALLRQNPQMQLMVDVLGHLDYNQLHARINLNNQGTLSIQGELMGVNKKYKSGAPINFNPNIELDFTDLIKSLQISDNISQSLDNKVNEKKLD